MKDTTVILLIAAGLAAAYFFSKSKATAAQSAPVPTSPNDNPLGQILQGVLGKYLPQKGGNQAIQAQPGFATASPGSPALTGASYNIQGSKLSGVADLVTAGTGALSGLFNIGNQIFGKSASVLPSVAPGASIPTSAVTEGVDWPTGTDWGTYA